MIYRLEDRIPQYVGDDQFVAACATLIGSVVLHERASIWFGAILRADNDLIVIGPETNVQDAAILHTDPGIPLTLGRGVTVGHRAVLHGCTVGDYSLIGIGATVLNGARIGRHCLIGAGALVPERAEIPDGSLVIGMPARVKRALLEHEQKGLEYSAAHYVANAARYRSTLRVHEVSPA
ncbi:MAG: gamma carbonic anhydrase family protein [Gammaproteobacteria bacterium]|nr:gamma carbonic anhydrase family protein [Gammaproteobacteria bacterium]